MVRSMDQGCVPVHAPTTTDEPEDGQFQDTPDHVTVATAHDGLVQATPRSGGGVLLQGDFESMCPEMCIPLSPILPLPITHASAV